MPKGAKKKKPLRSVSQSGHVLEIVTAFGSIVEVNEDGEVNGTENERAQAAIRGILFSCGYRDNTADVEDLDRALSIFLASHTATPGTVLRLTGDDFELLPRIAEQIHRMAEAWIRDNSSSVEYLFDASDAFFAQFGIRLCLGEELGAERSAKYELRGNYVVNVEHPRGYDAALPENDDSGDEE